MGCSLGANYGSYSNQSLSAGSYRSQHFVVTAPTTEFARQVCVAAERFRKSLALEWLGQELPPWRDACPIQVMAGPQLGAGGATSFTFINGEPRDWHMEIQGSRARILDSVLPHEITHMVLATHLGRPLPRWADEGAATSVEHISERSKQDKLLIQFLTTDRGIAFNHLFAMKEYPQDILPLYSQGYSLARFLIAKGGRRGFVDYISDGLSGNNWTAATQKHYAIHSLSELQLTWLDWVRKGSPDAVARVTPISYAQNTRQPTPSSGPAIRSASGVSGLVPLPNPITPRSQPATRAMASRAEGTELAADSQRGWYSRRRDAARNQTNEASPTDSSKRSNADGSQGPLQVGRPQSPQGPGQIILQWSRSDAPQSAGTGAILR